MERSTSSHPVSKPCPLSFEATKSFACSTDAEVVTDHASDLFSFQESIVLLCLLLFHVDLPFEISGLQLLESTRIFFESTTSKSGSTHNRIRRLKFVHILGGRRFISLIHTVDSFGKLELEQTSLLQFISNLFLSASVSSGTPLFC